MEEFLSHIQDVLNVPEFLINQCSFMPDYIKEALIVCVKFIPWLYFLYYGIELLERFFLRNIGVLVKCMKHLGALFGVVISVVPECGYSVIASTFYSRRMITRGTLLAYLIVCSDDALPLLFMDLEKAFLVVPIILIKMIAGIAVSFLVDLTFVFQRGKKITEDINAINIDLNEPGCCHHRIVSTEQEPPFWWKHAIVHTFNMFMFTFFSMAFFNCVIIGFGGAENLAQVMMIDSPIQVVAAALLGLIPNCAISVFLAVAFLKGVLSFPAFLAGLVTTAGLGLATLYKRTDNNDSSLITLLLLISGIAVGLIVFYNMNFVEYIQSFYR